MSIDSYVPFKPDSLSEIFLDRSFEQKSPFLTPVGSDVDTANVVVKSDKAY